jgi:hypothetical protein
MHGKWADKEKRREYQQPAGHAIAFGYDDENDLTYFMDPNLGDFQYSENDDHLPGELFHYLWNLYRFKGVIYWAAEITYFGLSE